MIESELYLTFFLRMISSENQFSPRITSGAGFFGITRETFGPMGRVQLLAVFSLRAPFAAGVAIALPPSAGSAAVLADEGGIAAGHGEPR